MMRLRKDVETDVRKVKKRQRKSQKHPPHQAVKEGAEDEGSNIPGGGKGREGQGKDR